MRAGLAAAVAVENERVVPDLEVQAVRHRVLPRLDAVVDELFDVAAVKTHDMIVMGPLVELEDSHAVLEVVPSDQAGRLELREHAVDGRKPDVLVRLEQAAVDVLGRQMPRLAPGEDLEDLQARQRHFQAGFTQVLAFHASRASGSDHRAPVRRRLHDQV